jgi:uncharacterized protein YecE (DUF72 family)
VKRGNIYIGTSGWHYPHWVGPFYPKGMPSEDFLSYYIGRFQTVEINNTFYHLPSKKTLAGWREATPKNFLFSCKASRFITHMKKLKDPDHSLPRFFTTIDVLGNKLGPVLFQLPPRWRVNPERLEAFLDQLPRDYRFAFEFRDESWFTRGVSRLLSKYGAAFCIYDLAGHHSPEDVTSDFVYIRLHGPDDPYRGQYDARVLRKWASKCTAWSRSGHDVYCYFDNDEKGYASQDALRLQNLVEEKR